MNIVMAWENIECSVLAARNIIGLAFVSYLCLSESVCICMFFCRSQMLCFDRVLVKNRKKIYELQKKRKPLGIGKYETLT